MATPPQPDPGGPQDIAGEGTAVPTCFRHPDRETYVSCVRCGRPACPDCLRSAAVGQQCVECVRQASRTTRRPAGAFGGQLTSGATVTWTLVGINVACYLAEIFFQNPVIDHGVLVGRIGPDLGVANGEVYRLLSNTFLHEPIGSGLGLLHIVFNMWALIVVGPSLERMLGRVRFLAVYLVSALAGSVLFYLVAAPAALALGASGAIFGLFGSWFVLARRLRLDARQIIVLIVINLGISFAVPGIAWQAHVGGLVAGAALTAAFAYAPRRSRAVTQAAATIAILAILVIAVVIRDHQLVGAVRL
ncbi:MAG TPA: rhomboid family intramembrane serine protease [Streptosporangiaceae bacterium]